MDNYQKYLMAFKDSYYRFATNGNLAKESVLVGDKIVLTQNDDISISDYVLDIVNESIESIFAIKDSERKEFSKKVDDTSTSTFFRDEPKEKLFIAIDFENKFDGIEIVFKNNLADNLFLPIEYVLADKEKYYAKKEQERKDNLLKTASIKVSTGADLVNIYFQPCCDKYERTEISLYIPKDYITVGGKYGPEKQPSTWSLIKKCKIEADDFFKSISGLAYGKYAFILKQFDKTGNILLETEYVQFSIYKPEVPEFGWVNEI